MTIKIIEITNKQKQIREFVETGTPVSIFLKTGPQLQGKLAWYDSCPNNHGVIGLQRDGFIQIIYEENINTIGRSMTEGLAAQPLPKVRRA